MSPTHGWLCGVVVMTPDWESVGCEFKYRNFFWKEKPSQISLILNTKSEKNMNVILIHIHRNNA